jgi:hypothetical protein
MALAFKWIALRDALMSSSTRYSAAEEIRPRLYE